MSIRPATPGDVPVVATLEQELFGADAWSAASVAEELTGPRRHALVACDDDGAVVGYVVTLASGDVVDLQRIGVAPGARRTGVAAALLAQARKQSLAAGGDRMLLEVSAGNTGARAFYAASGFVQIDRRPHYYRDGTDALVLRGTLGRGACGGRRP